MVGARREGRTKTAGAAAAAHAIARTGAGKTFAASTTPTRGAWGALARKGPSARSSLRSQWRAKPSAIPSGGTIPRVRSACMIPIVIRLLPENRAVATMT